MRRARIKAIATVPVRRKVIHEASILESTPDNDDNKRHTEEINESKSLCVIQKSSEGNEETKQSIPISTLSDESQSEKVHRSNIVTTPKEDVVCCATQADNVSSVDPHTTEIIIPSSPQITQNRSCFTRPMPRLESTGHVRRNSTHGSGTSASESEDDNRKNNTLTAPCRIHNDSMTTLQGNKEISNDVGRTELSKLKIGQKRRILLSESAQKLAEARREFYLKHENKTPDRSKLTMYDLIYYNPVTNPMRKSKEGTTIIKKNSPSPSVELPEEENEDDPSVMPVPQVKVGPDGLLIIDEQSLVIEQTNARKSREVLRKQAIIDDDNNGSGFYKRRQKSKDWSKWETLKFYKALNTVGTDFLLMQSLFPNRTRQEIKLKFKKEERINRKLVEKALVYHQEFDIETLEKELATFHETEQRESKSLVEKLKYSRRRNKKGSSFGRKRTRRIAASSIAEMDASEDEREQEREQEREHEREHEREQEREHEREQEREQEQEQEEERNIEGMENQPQNDINTVVAPLSPNNDSGSETEIYQIRPTRSGRLPKVRKLQGPDINMFDITDCSMNYKIAQSLESSDEVETLNTSEDIRTIRYPASIKNAIPNIDAVEPGSLVILTKESPEEPGKTVLQVYMVSSNTNSPDESVKRSITPVNLSPELLATVTNKLTEADPLSVKKECE